MRLLWIVLVLLSFSVQAFSKEVIVMISPYDTPPFIVDQKKEEGLVFELAALLTARSRGKYEFKVSVLPRTRLLKVLEKSGVVVVPLVAPKWFEDAEEKKFFWTSAMMDDENLVLSPRKKPVDFRGMDSLKHLKTTVVSGHSMETVTNLQHTGEVDSLPTNSLSNGLKMLARGRIDFMITGRLVADYLIQDLNLGQDIYISDRSVEKFERKFLLSRDADKHLQKWLEGEIQRLRRSGEWKKFLGAFLLQNRQLFSHPKFV
ncbi:ABC transporter substrate-binding protein [Bdellovibrio bacteriovorus]|uniref:substrate-binding periplasmic protein n=1 Tax=Bdellovibrio bacteriovorus TaxID=959 RepID=UPI0021CE5B39|nr:ABC transporter substrate-binding protein [Bdellovibrio bacteriovorus]UXR64792.1 ABC transporter substrate-binding protein [Bdellovibrio bacteriovorus]